MNVQNYSGKCYRKWDKYKPTPYKGNTVGDLYVTLEYQRDFGLIKGGFSAG